MFLHSFNSNPVSHRNTYVSIPVTLFLVCCLFFGIVQSSHAGFTGYGYKGRELTRQEHFTVLKAIGKMAEISQKESDPLKSWYISYMAMTLARALHQGRINAEIRSYGIDGVALSDDKTTTKGDKINIRPNIISPDGENFILLTATLFHEGHHMTQPGGLSEAEAEYAAYQWSLYFMQKLNSKDKEEIQFLNESIRKYEEDILKKRGINTKKATTTTGAGGKTGIKVKDALQIADTPKTIQWYLSNIETDDESPYVIARDFTDGNPGISMEYDFGFDYPLDFAFARNSSGAFYIIVSGTDLTETSGGIKIMTDADSDGFPDPSTLATLVSPGELRIPRSMALTDGGDLYILDIGPDSQDTPYIYVAYDTDNDNMPDLPLHVFADPLICPPLPSGWSISLAGQSPAATIRVSHQTAGATSSNWHDDAWLLTDNGAPENPPTFFTQPGYFGISGLHPCVTYEPQDGDQSVIAQSSINTIVELYEISYNGAKSKKGVLEETRRLLGDASITSSSLEEEIIVSGGEKLVEGQVLQLYNTTEDIWGTTFTVQATGPQIFDVSPPEVYSDEWVTITGRNFASDTEIYIGDRVGKHIDVTPTTITFQMPYLFDSGMTIGFSHAITVESFSTGKPEGEAFIIYKGKGPGANAPPFADAGKPQKAWQKTVVTLDGSHSWDEDRDPLTFTWSTFSSGILIDDANSSVTTFTAPATTTQRNLFFDLQVSDGKETERDGVGVTVLANPPGDVDQSGVLDSGDSDMMIDFILGRISLTSDEKMYADINSDIAIDIADLVLLVGKID